MTKGICETCGQKSSQLFTHHWFEPPEYIRCQAEVCPSCNRALIPQYLWQRVDKRIRDKVKLRDHVLPSLELQRLFMQGKRQEYLLLLCATYSFPLQSRPLCKMCGSPMNMKNGEYICIQSKVGV